MDQKFVSSPPTREISRSAQRSGADQALRKPSGKPTDLHEGAYAILRHAQVILDQAERAGFEPAVRFDPHTAFPVKFVHHFIS